MNFREIKTADYRVGIWVEEPSINDAGQFKLDREKQGKKNLIKKIFPTSTPDWVYEESGKPVFIGRHENLSFSHSENVYACQISQTIVCGIDVQHYKEKILRVPDKFLNQTELDFIKKLDASESVKILTAMWSCKEALYKMYGKGFIDYVNLFTIHPFNLLTTHIQASANLGNGIMTYFFHIEFTDTFVLVFHTLSPLTIGHE